MSAAPDPPVRVGLVSARPLPATLVGHAHTLLAAATGSDVVGADTSRPGSSGYTWTAARLPRDGDGGTAVAAELRGPATALGVDVALSAGGLVTDGIGLLVTDVDSTFVSGEVIELLAQHAGTRDEVAAITGRAMRGELDFTTSLQQRVATLAGLDVAALDAVRDEIELSPGACELVTAVHAGGGRIGLVSGGFIEVVEPLAVELGIAHVAANRLEVVGGRLTGRTVGPVIDRAAKAALLRRWRDEDGVSRDRVVAVGDGANDLDMLAAAGLGVAYCAKPIVQQRAAATLSFPRLDALLGLLGH